VTDSSGDAVAWNSGGYSDFHLNNGNDFWAVLHDHPPGGIA
jgi:hypothetical protein